MSQFIKWLITAGLTFSLDILLFTLFANFVTSPFICNTISFSLSTLFNYASHKYWSFGNKKVYSSIRRYTFLLISTFVGNSIILYCFLFFNFEISTAKLMANMIMIPLNFLALKHFVFKSDYIPHLPLSTFELIEFYKNCYLEKHHSSKSLSLFHRIKHFKLEKSLSNQHFPITLELGSGNLEHRKYIKHQFDIIIYSDLRIPEVLPGEINLITEFSPALNPGEYFQKIDILNIPFGSKSVDRIVLTCVLMHIDDIYTALVELKRIVKIPGQIDIYIPNSPGVLYRAFSKIAILGKKSDDKFFYEIYNLIEHVQNISNILKLVRIIFNGHDIKISQFPFGFIKSWNLNIFTTIRIK